MAARSWRSPLLRVSLESDLVAAGPRRRQLDNRQKRRERRLVAEDVGECLLRIGGIDEDVDRGRAIGCDEGVQIHAAIQAIAAPAVEMAVAGVPERDDTGTSATDPRGPLPRGLALDRVLPRPGKRRGGRSRPCQSSHRSESVEFASWRGADLSPCCDLLRPVLGAPTLGIAHLGRARRDDRLGDDRIE
jgi:hypothetical protein